MKVWVVTGDSESGDDYGPFVFSKKPSKEKLRKLCEEHCDWGEGDGPGNFGSYTYLTTTACEVDKP